MFVLENVPESFLQGYLIIVNENEHCIVIEITIKSKNYSVDF